MFRKVHNLSVQLGHGADGPRELGCDIPGLLGEDSREMLNRQERFQESRRKRRQNYVYCGTSSINYVALVTELNSYFYLVNESLSRVVSSALHNLPVPNANSQFLHPLHRPLMILLFLSVCPFLSPVQGGIYDCKFGGSLSTIPFSLRT